MHVIRVQDLRKADARVSESIFNDNAVLKFDSRHCDMKVALRRCEIKHVKAWLLNHTHEHSLLLDQQHVRMFEIITYAEDSWSGGVTSDWCRQQGQNCDGRKKAVLYKLDS